MRAYDNQEVSDWQDCAFYHLLRHRFGWVPDFKAVPLSFGSLWGLVMDKFWEVSGDPLSEMLAVADQEYAPLRELDPALLKHRTWDVLEAMVRDYVAWALPARDQYELVEGEKPFLLILGQQNGETVYHSGRIDKVLRRKSDERIICHDHKTSSLYAVAPPHFQWGFLFQWHPHNQMLGYTWAAKQLYGDRFDDMIVEAALVYKNTKGPVTAFDWIPMGYTDRDLEDWRRGRLETIRLMSEQKYAAKSTGQCINKYGTCVYHSLCRGGFLVDQDSRVVPELPDGFRVEHWNTLEKIGYQESDDERLPLSG